jgi:pectate lyase
MTDRKDGHISTHKHKGNFMNKNPYELRMDMVHLANDYFKDLHSMQHDMAINAFNIAVEQGKTTWTEWEKHAPKMYSFDEVTKKAEELYAFVSKK